MKENSSYYYQLIFKKVFDISTMIFDEYQHLSNLEKARQKDTPEYESSFKKLKTLLEQEQEYYNSIKNNKEILNSLLHKIAYFNKNSNDFIISQNNNSLIYARISLKLNDLITEISQSKSPEIFYLFNKFELFSLIHFENTLLALIMFQNFLKVYHNPILQDILTSILYSYSFMFPYIENIVLKENFTIPQEMFSISEYFSDNINVPSDIISKYKNRRFQQIKKYMEKNNPGTNNYLFLLFYLKAISTSLDQNLTDDIDTLLNANGLYKETKNELKIFLHDEKPDKLIRKITFNI